MLAQASRSGQRRQKGTNVVKHVVSKLWRVIIAILVVVALVSVLVAPTSAATPQPQTAPTATTTVKKVAAASAMLDPDPRCGSYGFRMDGLTYVAMGLATVTRRVTIPFCDPLVTWEVDFIRLGIVVTSANPYLHIAVRQLPNFVAAYNRPAVVKTWGWPNSCNPTIAKTTFGLLRASLFAAESIQHVANMPRMVHTSGTLFRINWEKVKYEPYGGQTISIKSTDSGPGWSIVDTRTADQYGRINFWSPQFGWVAKWRLYYPGNTQTLGKFGKIMQFDVD